MDRGAWQATQPMGSQRVRRDWACARRSVRSESWNDHMLINKSHYGCWREMCSFSIWGHNSCLFTLKWASFLSMLVTAMLWALNECFKNSDYTTHERYYYHKANNEEFHTWLTRFTESYEMKLEVRVEEVLNWELIVKVLGPRQAEIWTNPLTPDVFSC